MSRRTAADVHLLGRGSGVFEWLGNWFPNRCSDRGRTSDHVANWFKHGGWIRATNLLTGYGIVTAAIEGDNSLFCLSHRCGFVSGLPFLLLFILLLLPRGRKYYNELT